MSSKARAIDLRRSTDRTLVHLLVNTLLVSVINFTMWFAVTFWVFLETHSVLATGMVAGIFLLTTAASGIWFGSLVDRHGKKTVMQASAVVSLTLYAAAFTLYELTPKQTFANPASLTLWIFIVMTMLGVITGNIRSIALQTLVTVLISEDRRDRANGLVGTTTGVSFLVTSVISGVLVAAGDMFYVLLLAIAVLGVSVAHLALVRVADRPQSSGTPVSERSQPQAEPNKVDLRGTLRLVRGVPGLLALIGFSCFNNFLGGTFMALMDAYGLSLMSVESWGLLWGALSTGFIVGGLAVAKTGLGKSPVRVLLLINVVLWSVTCLFPLRSSVILLTAGMAVYMVLIPYAEAAEQTVLQQVVPFERQGRVFGFAQSVEQAASPLTAFLIGPLTQLIFIPFMTAGAGADLIGGWFGTGPDRGIALGLRPDRHRRAWHHGICATQPTLSAAERPLCRAPRTRSCLLTGFCWAHAGFLGVDQGAFRRDGVGVLVVEPDTAGSEVAELDRLACRHCDAYAPRTVAAAYQLVGSRHPVVEGPDCRNRSVVDVIWQDELDSSAGSVGFDIQGHESISVMSRVGWSSGRA
jgi:MFS transporter, DHA3 family, multidrug efflux protein